MTNLTFQKGDIFIDNNLMCYIRNNKIVVVNDEIYNHKKDLKEFLKKEFPYLALTAKFYEYETSLIGDDVELKEVKYDSTI